MGAYNDALYQFVVSANPQTIAHIRECWVQQQQQEQKWWKARQQLEQTGAAADLEAFDLKVYENMVSHSRSAHALLKALKVPLFDQLNAQAEPKAAQQLLAVLGDLAAARGPNSAT